MATKIAKGTPVKVKRGEFKARGKYLGKYVAPNGEWHRVDISAKGEPVKTRNYRAANIST